ncbi:MAG: hypothetical protein V4649_03355 [Bacteroidota bacterium]
MRTILIAAACLISAHCHAQSIISTIAGNGLQSYSGDGGPAVTAQLSCRSICADHHGNIYIADQFNNRIRKIDAFGTITTVAGNGSSGHSGDGAPAINATLNGPTAVCLNAVGDLFIADRANGKVRMVNAASGIITTVAGNGALAYSGDGAAATDAGIELPIDICTDSKGDLYIAAWNRVRKVEVATGIIFTFAGNGTDVFSGDGGPAPDAGLGDIGGICVNANDDLFVSDSRYNRVRRISRVSGTITTIAGNGYTELLHEPWDDTYVGDYSGDGGPATAARLNHPTGLFTDPSGTLFIADYYNNVVRAVSPGGIINTVAGNGSGKATLTFSILFYSGDYSGDGAAATAAKLYGPNDICMDNRGNILIADQNNNRIRRITNPVGVNNTSSVTQFSLFPNPVTGSFTVATAQGGTFSIYDLTGRKLHELALTKGSNSATIPATMANGNFVGVFKADNAELVETVMITVNR